MTMQMDDEIIKRQLLTLDYMFKYGGDREITFKPSGEIVIRPSL